MTTSANQYMALFVNNAQVATAYASAQSNYMSTYHIADLVNADAGTTVKVRAAPTPVAGRVSLLPAFANFRCESTLPRV